MNQITIKRFNNREQEAFKEIFNWLVIDMIHYSESITGDHHESEDIVMKVFNSIWMSAVQFDSASDFKYYMVNCTKNASLNYLKSRRRYMRRCESVDNIDVIEEDDKHGYYTEFRNLVYSRIRELKDNHRDILLMTAQGYSNKEISQRYRTSLNTIQVIKHRLINALRKEFK